MERKKIVTDLNDLANKLCLIEGKKHNLNVADIKELLRCLVMLEATSIIATRKSAVMLLRRKARFEADKYRKKKSNG